MHVPTSESKHSLSQKSDTSEICSYTAENPAHKVAYAGDGQYNGHTRHYRYKTVYVGCNERTLVVSFIIPLFVYTV
jgi:hypothetical protein